MHLFKSQKLNKLLNISSNEWPRVVVAFSMLFFLRFGFVVGWTTLVANFLGIFGAKYLAALLLSNAMLMMIGAQIYRKLIHKIKREILMILSVIFSSFFLLMSIPFIESQPILFTAFVLIAQGITISQLGILINLFNEDLFTPLESERTFPIIESAEIFGAIVGGLTLTFFSEYIAMYKFISLWVLALFLILVIVLSFNSKTMEVPKLSLEGLESKNHKKFKDKISEFTKIPFLKSVMIIVFLNWAIFNIVEFQYTKAVLDSVLQTHGTNHAVSLAADLGFFHVIFSFGALFIQLIFTSRIIESLGIASSITVHPIVTFLNLILQTTKFNLLTAAITKGSFEITNLISTNAYNSSYYAIPHHYRDDVKEVMQGVFKPFGAIVGTLLIIIVSYLFSTDLQIFSMNVILILMTVTMAIIAFGLNQKYTDMAEQNLSSKLDLPTRLNAVEILAQNGHGKLTGALQKLLNRENESTALKESILFTLGARQDTDYINDIVEKFDDEDEDIRLAAVKAIMNFHKLEAKVLNQTFTRHGIIEKLKNAIKKEKNEHIKENMIIALHQIDPDELTMILIKHMEEEDLEPTMIRTLKLFNDPNLVRYVEPLLNNEKLELRAAAIIALWQFEKERSKLMHYLNQMLKSNSKKALILGIESTGLVKYKEAKNILREMMHNDDKEIKEEAILALSRLEDEAVIDELTKLLCNETHHYFSKVNYILSGLSEKFREKVKLAMHLNISDRISSIIKKYKNFEEIEKDSLKLLSKLYKQIGIYQESFKIERHIV